MSLISVRHLCKSYGDIQPLIDLNCEIEQGEVISLIGPSGTGKSTLLRCMNLLERADSGEIWIEGTNILQQDTKLSLLRQKMGMVFQNFNLFPHLMMIENVMLGPVELKGAARQEAYDRGMELLRSVGMAEKAFAYPDELSGGQKQRAAIARTLSMNPEIILFDEPTSALDPTMVGEVISVIRGLVGRGLTMLIVTHEMKLARDISTRVFYMDEGIIYEEGTPEKIFVHPQKEKTRLFIHQLKPFRYAISSRDFDFLDANSKLLQFLQQLMVPDKISYQCQMLFEELFMQCVLPHLPQDFAAEVNLGWSERNGTMEFCLSYDGGRYDPRNDPEADAITLQLLRKMAPEIAYRYEQHRNYLQVLLD